MALNDLQITKNQPIVEKTYVLKPVLKFSEKEKNDATVITTSLKEIYDTFAEVAQPSVVQPTSVVRG